MKIPKYVQKEVKLLRRKLKEKKGKVSFGDTLNPCARINSRKAARAWLGELVRISVKYHGRTVEDATAVWKSNIGYWSGYYSARTAQRIMKLFDTAHPFFGRSTPTPEKAIEMGKALAKKK